MLLLLMFLLDMLIDYHLRWFLLDLVLLFPVLLLRLFEHMLLVFLRGLLILQSNGMYCFLLLFWYRLHFYLFHWTGVQICLLLLWTMLPCVWDLLIDLYIPWIFQLFHRSLHTLCICILVDLVWKYFLVLLVSLRRQWLCQSHSKILMALALILLADSTEHGLVRI